MNLLIQYPAHLVYKETRKFVGQWYKIAIYKAISTPIGEDNISLKNILMG